MIPIAWGFFSFLFYRIMTAAMFSDPMSIIGSALCGLLTTVILMVTTVYYGFALGRSVAQEERGGSALWLRGTMFLPMIVAAMSNLAAGFLISLGFSERLYNDITRYSSYRDWIQQDWFWFVLIMLIPIISHFFVSVRLANKARAETRD